MSSQLIFSCNYFVKILRNHDRVGFHPNRNLPRPILSSRRFSKITDISVCGECLSVYSCLTLKKYNLSVVKRLTFSIFGLVLA